MKRLHIENRHVIDHWNRQMSFWDCKKRQVLKKHIQRQRDQTKQSTSQQETHALMHSDRTHQCRIIPPQTSSLEQKIMHSNTCEETHTFTQIRWLPSCYRQSRRSVVFQRPDDSAHSFLAVPSLCASHHSDKQDSMPTYLTELTPLSTTFYFTRGTKHTKLPTLHP